MKKSVSFLCSALLIGFTLVSTTGCKKDKKNEDPTPIVIGNSNGQLSFTINGDGFANKTYSTNKGVTLAWYDASDDRTAVGVNDGTAEASKYVQFAIDFEGKTTGEFPIDNTEDESAGLYLSIKDGSTEKIYVASEGTLKVTKYGNVGATIEGTFAGKLTDLTGTVTVTLTNGSFAAARVNNQ